MNWPAVAVAVSLYAGTGVAVGYFMRMKRTALTVAAAILWPLTLAVWLVRVQIRDYPDTYPEKEDGVDRW
jgi:hypothetical protein